MWSVNMGKNATYQFSRHWYVFHGYWGLVDPLTLNDLRARTSIVFSVRFGNLVVDTDCANHLWVCVF